MQSAAHNMAEKGQRHSNNESGSDNTGWGCVRRIFFGVLVLNGRGNCAGARTSCDVTDREIEVCPIKKYFDALVIPSEKIAVMKIVNADSTSVTKEFAIDAAIGSGQSGNRRRMKELTPWECSEETPDDLVLEQPGKGWGDSSKLGWDPKDMFKKNEEKYGVVSSFKHDLSGYTTKVDKSDTAVFERLDKEATLVATEIERQASSWEQSQAGEGDEEEAFSAVVRPQSATSTCSDSVNVNNNIINTSSEANGKYIPPSRRQTNAKPSAPPPTQSYQRSNYSDSWHTNTNSGRGRKVKARQNQNPITRNNYGAPAPTCATVYHQNRRNFDSRVAPLPNQYGHSTSHGEVRRPEDYKPRPKTNPQVPMDRNDPVKSNESGNSSRLEQAEVSRSPWPQGNPPPRAGMRSHVVAAAQHAARTRNSRPPSAPVAPVAVISSSKMKTEEPEPSLMPMIPTNAASESVKSPSVSNPPASSESISTSLIGSSDNPSPSSNGGSKSEEAKSQQKFALNPNAKEFI